MSDLVALMHQLAHLTGYDAYSLECGLLPRRRHTQRGFQEESTCSHECIQAATLRFAEGKTKRPGWHL